LVIEAEALVVRAAVVAAESEEALVPTATGFDVGDGDERLRTHTAPSSGARRGDTVLQL
jgi:hypothetical protein